MQCCPHFFMRISPKCIGAFQGTFVLSSPYQSRCNGVQRELLRYQAAGRQGLLINVNCCYLHSVWCPEDPSVWWSVAVCQGELMRQSQVCVWDWGYHCGDVRVRT